MKTTTRTETYTLLTSTGRYIRKATKVVFADGREVKFIERMPASQAIPQAVAYLAREAAL